MYIVYNTGEYMHGLFVQVLANVYMMECHVMHTCTLYIIQVSICMGFLYRFSNMCM